MRLIGYPLALIAVFVLIGGHWAVLQTAAWAGMIIGYSQEVGLSRGLSKTFDGKHPCKLCLKVKEGQEKEEQKAPSIETEKKAEVFLLSASEEIKAPLGSPFFQSIPWKLTYSTRSDPLPSPVPRKTIA